MADLKGLLKEARKLIDEKNYKEAQDCCKNILRKDKQNYFGLVLLGKSFQDSDQAPLAYQKAIACKRDQPLAWQGLAQYYECKEDELSKLKLIQVYNEMLTLQIEDDKVLEIITKLGQVGLALNNTDTISILANFISKTENEKLKNSAVNQFLGLLKADVPVKEDDVMLIRNTLFEINKEQPSESLELVICKIMLRTRNLNSAIDEITKFHFTKDTVIKEFVCKWLCTKFVKTMSFNEFNIENQIDVLTSGIEDSKHAVFLKSICLFIKGCYLNAYKLSVPLINYNETDEFEAVFVIKCTIMLKKWSVAQKLAINFITKAKQESLIQELRKYLFISLAKQQKWRQAIANAKMFEINILNEEELACLTECYIEELEPAETLMEQLKSTDYYKSLQALSFIKQKKYQEAITLLQQDSSNNALHSFYLGLAYWEIKEYDKCLLNLLKAAKQNPDHADTFFSLGQYYNYQKKDLLKAKKCYEKAHMLNSTDSSIVKSLSETYIQLQQSEADFDLLTDFLQSVVNVEPWVNFRLGLHYLNKREWENAITHFRNVIKSNQNDTTAFQCLADAYYSRGSYSSALRAYNKVMILDPSKSSHCLTRIGYIHSLLTQYDQAISTFQLVISNDPDSYLPLKGIAETWMRIAKKKVTAKTFGTARDCAQNAVNHIILALKKQSQFTCFWKLLADTLMFITKLPDQYSYVYLPNETETKKYEKTDIYPQAIAYYSRIAKLTNLTSSYDLAYAYYHYYQHTQKTLNCHISFNLTMAAIKNKPSSWRNWNLLGKICLPLKKYELAQHCFIKALQVTKKISVAKIWCNLGTLYLKLKLYKLANYCFWRGQSTLPSYPQSWIGQALIAEVIREEEAMDLFRHASRLGYHPESALGYADWVCRTLKDNKYTEDPESKYVIEGLYAIPYAMDLIEWFITFEPNNACASNILGILQERSGLLKPAMKSYEQAFKYGDDNQKNIVLLNIGRVLIRLEKYPEAVKIYKAITEASFNSTVGLALALFKNGLYEESYSVYDTALHWLCNNDNEKSNLLVAMAGIVYMFKGVDDAKTILFHSIQVSQNKPSPYSLFAICSLGLTHSEQSLTKLALSELRNFERDSQFGYDIGFLKSYCFFLEDNIEHAIKLLSESLHDHPNNALMWVCLSQYCLRVSETKAKEASCCAQKALCAAHFGEFTCNLANILATASIAEYISGDKKKALTLAKEGLHMYPNQAEIWAALLFSLLTHNVWIEKKNWLLAVAGHMRRHLTISRPLSRWVSLMEKKLSKGV